MKELVEGISVVPAWQQVVDRVRRALQLGRLKPGDRVVESQLSEWLGISRNPIREALRQLQQQGFLEYRHHAGTVVSHLSGADVLLALRIRAFLEVQAVELIVAAGDPRMLRPLERIVERMGALSEDDIAEQCEMLDEEFHKGVIAISGSAMLQRAWDAIDPYTWMAIAFQEFGAQPPIPKGLQEQHHGLVEVLKSGDNAVAETAFYTHIMDVKRSPRHRE